MPSSVEHEIPEELLLADIFYLTTSQEERLFYMPALSLMEED